jgi:hypothetical protein
MRFSVVFFGIVLSLVVLFAAWSNLFREQRSLGDYERAALLLDRSPKREWCDLQTSQSRLRLARLIDHFRPRIQELFNAQSGADFPEFKMESVGPILLRLSPSRKAAQDYEISSWSWEDARDKYLKTQRNPLAKDIGEQWRAIDTAVRYLLEQDLRRLVFSRPQLEPEKTLHLFQPKGAVIRSKQNEWQVKLSAGDFAGSEKKIEEIFRRQWWSHGRKVQILWVGPGDTASYKLVANRRSARSFVDHKTREMVIAHLAWTRTVSHELGHILGFDDHYYSVWNSENCYYQQKARLGDLMSHSETGEITEEHWQLLEKAYSLDESQTSKDFRYVYGKPVQKAQEK